METLSPPVAGSRQSSGKRYLGLGIGLALLGPILYTVQIRAKLLSVPWYAPVLATVGVAVMLLVVRRRPTVWRVAALALVGLLAGAQWYFLLSLSKLPVYAGPVSAKTAFPVFRTNLADGTTFDQESLRGEQNTALVFFRGRW